MLRCVLLSLNVCAAASGHSQRARAIESIKSSFIHTVGTVAADRAQHGRLPPAVTLLDVGTNAGTFSAAMMTWLHRRAPAVAPRLVMFEPQPQFRTSLATLAERWNGVLLPAAAWTHDTKLTFHIDRNNSESSSLLEKADKSVAKHQRSTIVVPAVDFAAYLLRDLLPAPATKNNDSIAFLKFDVEGAEFDVMPQLIKTHALCRTRFLLIEWHIRTLPEARRAAGLAMKEALSGILSATCLLPPLLVHDNIPLNNHLAPDTPGLDAVGSTVQKALFEARASRLQSAMQVLGYE